jgi:amidophosphoribosyltransferase
MVIPVPDSGVPAALGYSKESNIPFELGIIRNHYVGRTFIEPAQEIRDLKVKMKLSPIKELIAGKKIIVIDDSIVRGTTSKQIVRMLRDAGAAEVHMRISSPPTSDPCFYGIEKLQTKGIGVCIFQSGCGYVILLIRKQKGNCESNE